MPAKKKQDTGPTTSQIAEHLGRQDAVLEKLGKKLEDAHVLNGGFETLMEKVGKIDAIETDLKGVRAVQVTQGTTLAEVHKAIYDKDEGLYQKVKAALTWIKNANWVIKTVLVFMATGVAGGLAKLLFDIITGKLLIHYAGP